MMAFFQQHPAHPAGHDTKKAARHSVGGKMVGEKPRHVIRSEENPLSKRHILFISIFFSLNKTATCCYYPCFHIHLQSSSFFMFFIFIFDLWRSLPCLNIHRDSTLAPCRSASSTMQLGACTSSGKPGGVATCWGLPSKKSSNWMLFVSFRVDQTETRPLIKVYYLCIFGGA